MYTNAFNSHKTVRVVMFDEMVEFVKLQRNCLLLSALETLFRLNWATEEFIKGVV